MPLDVRTKNKKAGGRNAEYLALVVDNVDPEGLRRIKFRLREIHRGIEDDKLPWVKCDFGMGVGGNSPGIGSQSIPPIGTKIMVRVSDNSNYNFQYAGPGYQDEDKTDELDPSKPNQAGFIDPFGNKWLMDYEEGSYTLHHKSGTKVLIGSDGAVNIEAKEKIIISSEDDIDIRGQNINIDAQESLKVRAGGTLKLHGGDGVDVRGVPLNLNQSTSPESPTAPITTEERQTPERRDVSNKTDF